MRQVAHQEPRRPDHDAKLVVDQAGRLALIEAAQVESGLANLGRKVIRDQRIELRVAVFHCHEAVSTHSTGLGQLRIAMPPRRREIAVYYRDKHSIRGLKSRASKEAALEPPLGDEIEGVWIDQPRAVLWSL